MSGEHLHEDEAALGPDTVDVHRALVSLGEELEAVDWYNQRARAAADGELRGILEHNRDEEKEHAAMVLEWLRRRDPALDRHLRTYLFTSKSITAAEAGANSGAESGTEGGTGDGSLGIGSLRQPTRPEAS